MSQTRVRLNNLSTQKVTGRSLRLSRLSRKRFPFPSAAVTAAAVYIEDVFSTYLYTGNGTTGNSQTINNGIDLAGKGGLVWIKDRTLATSSRLTDTWQTLSGGSYQTLSTAVTNGLLAYGPSGVTSFGSNGFTVYDTGPGGGSGFNSSADNYVSWTFRKQPKFFDSVTYTGDGVSGRKISHNLGSVPGVVIIKIISGATGAWLVWHRSFSNPYDYLRLNTASTLNDLGTINWMTAAPTSTDITLGSAYGNNIGFEFVAYFFAHDAGGFGATGTDNVISCGSFTSTGQFINLGWEPQWLLLKKNGATSDWLIFDNTRSGGATNYRAWRNFSGTGDETPWLKPNLADAESFDSNYGYPTATGFYEKNFGGGTWIYIAIRRGPMKTPTSGTSVFSPITLAVNGSTNQTLVDTGWPVDWQFGPVLADGSDFKIVHTRLIGGNRRLYTTATTAEEASGVDFGWSTGMKQSQTNAAATWYLWRRAPGFFDVVCYDGDSTFGRQVTHNLGVTPEMFIVKVRNAAGQDWVVYHKDAGATYKIILNSTAAKVSSTMFNNTVPSSTAFVVGANGNLGEVNFSSYSYVAYLFATCPGVSKVGSYTGTGTTLSIDCGFTAGARFVLIKRIDPGSTGDWYVWDTARGIVAGNDPYILLNSIAAAVTNTDYIDPYSPGFELSSTAPAALNASGGTYIFLAIA